MSATQQYEMKPPFIDPEGRPLIASLFGGGYGYCGESLAGNQVRMIGRVPTFREIRDTDRLIVDDELMPIPHPITIGHTFWDSCSTEPA